MDPKIQSLASTTFCGRRFTRKQIENIQTTVNTFSNLSRCELALTICEHLNWVTPSGANKINTCLNALEAMETLGLFTLPTKMTQKKKKQKQIAWTDKSNEVPLIDCNLDELMPLSLQMVIDQEQVTQWNEYVDRYHYLSYRRPIGTHLRYFILDRQGRKLGCLLFSFATWTLSCRDSWIGWTNEQREKHLNLVINNNRFLIFPWVNVKNLASKALSLAVRHVADDWETHYGYRPVLVETFVDSTQYTGTAYRAANWSPIGKTRGSASENNSESPDQKDVYIYLLQPEVEVRSALLDEKKSLEKKVQPFKTANIASDSHAFLWQKIITIVDTVASEFDQIWQKRRRIITTLLLILFIFRLVFSKNKQGYGTTIAELWDYCHKMNIQLPQKKPVAASAFCSARAKLDEAIFKILNTKIIDTYKIECNDCTWKQHRLFAVDGTKINLPHQLLKNSYKTPAPKAYYPQGLVSCLYELKSKIPVDFELSSHFDERKMAVEHLKVLQANDIVVYDRGYYSYFMLYTHYRMGIHAVFRMSHSTKIVNDFIEGSDMERIVIIHPNKKHQQKILAQHPGIEICPLTLRLIKYIILETTYVIGTTLTDAEQYKAEEFSDIYFSRWGIEELYKVSKVLIDVEDFHAQTERGVRQELFAHFTLITISRIFSNQTNDILMLNKKSDTEKKTKTNLKNCLITVARNLEALFLRQITYVKETISIIMSLVSTCRQKERPNRNYVRQSHKPRKKWELSRRKRALKAVELAA
jgi:hypothetical protein